VVLTSTSVYFGSQWASSARGLEAKNTQTRSKLQSEQALLEQLRESLTPSEAEYPLENTTSEVILLLLNNRTEYGVNLANVVPERSTSGDMVGIDELSEEVPGMSIKTVKVNITGTYDYYTGLVDYLNNLQKMPVAITRLKVQDNTFEASIRIFGTQS
jgi:hypothetical protein